MAKHQGSKVGADIYFRTPMSSKLIASIFSPFFDVDFDISSSEEPKKKPVLRTLAVLEEDESSDLMENLKDKAQELSSEDKAVQEDLQVYRRRNHQRVFDEHRLPAWRAHSHVFNLSESAQSMSEVE